MEQPFGFVENWPEWRRDKSDDFQRTAALGAELWGNAEHLTHQLLLPSPEIPSRATRKDLLALEWLARQRLASANQKWMPKPPIPVIVVGADHFNIYEAMYEVVRRAIASLGEK